MEVFSFAVWIAFGIAVGAAIGVAVDNLSTWVSIGVALGVAIGWAAGAGRPQPRYKGDSQPSDEEDEHKEGDGR